MRESDREAKVLKELHVLVLAEIKGAEVSKPKALQLLLEGCEEPVLEGGTGAEHACA